MSSKSTLILFVGPTRTATTSLFHSHITQSEMIQGFEFATTNKSEVYFHFNNLKQNKQYDHGLYMQSFMARDLPYYFDYDPMLFHVQVENEKFLRYFETVCQEFTYVKLFLVARHVPDLVRSVLQYSNILESDFQDKLCNYCLDSGCDKDSSKMIDSLKYFLDYERAAKRFSFRNLPIDVAIIPFSKLINNPNESIVSQLQMHPSSPVPIFYRTPLLHLNSSVSPFLRVFFSLFGENLPQSVRQSRRMNFVRNRLTGLFPGFLPHSAVSDKFSNALAKHLFPSYSSMTELELVKHLQSSFNHTISPP